ncbi:MAG: CopG family ribbon-helix-helix protein [Halobacteriota archaeon]
MSVISVSVDDDLLDDIDDYVERHGYSGRSELVREATRNLMGELQDTGLETRKLVATVTAIYDFDEDHAAEHKMTEMRHDYESQVKGNVHSHIGDDHCMELFVLEGDLDTVREFVAGLRTTPGVLSINYSVNPIDDLS